MQPHRAIARAAYTKVSCSAHYQQRTKALGLHETHCSSIASFRSARHLQAALVAVHQCTACTCSNLHAVSHARLASVPLLHAAAAAAAVASTNSAARAHGSMLHPWASSIWSCTGGGGLLQALLQGLPQALVLCSSGQQLPQQGLQLVHAGTALVSRVGHT
jgi:hypothetical protein